MEIFGNVGNDLGAKKGKKGQFDFECEKCDYRCSKKYSWERHILTPKHLKEINGNNLEIKKGKKGQKGQKMAKYYCDNCDKKFQTNAGLWKHKNKCDNINCHSDQVKNNDEPSDKDLIMLLIKENSELKNMMMKVIENGTHNTTNNNNTTTHTNSHNKAFNLNFFLNETCKDAMNIMDFVDSVKIQLSDLENVGKLGFVEGISNIIIKNLKALDVHKRPVHCSDSKREVMYIKDEDKWEKDNTEKKKLRKAIKHIAHKNSRMLPEFKAKYPDCGKSESKHADRYNKLVIEALGGKGDNDSEKEDKIIKKIAKEVIIEKDLENDK